MGFFNSGGLITRGMGEDHRLITRGFGTSFDFGGLPSRPRAKEINYAINLIVPIERENRGQINIFSTLELRRSASLEINLNIEKDVNEAIDMIANVDSDGLMDILEEI